MTNVPNDIREMWADLYRFYDINYKMPNTPEAWLHFWKQAEELKLKYPDQDRLHEFVMVIMEMLEDDRKPKQETHPCTLEDMKLF